MPDTIVLPTQMWEGYSSQASVEFPLYHFLFVQDGLRRQRRFRVLARTKVIRALEQLVRITLAGPDEAEMIEAGTNEESARYLAQEMNYLALKNPRQNNRPYETREIVHFQSLDPGKQEILYPLAGPFPRVLLQCSGENAFTLSQGPNKWKVDINVKDFQVPPYTIQYEAKRPVGETFGLTVLGRSNGFDPSDAANGYLIHVKNKRILWDSPPYLRNHLSGLNMKAEDIDAMIISHVHEDHLDIMQTLRDPPFPLYATPEVFHSMLIKLSAMMDIPLEEAQKKYDWNPIDVKKNFVEICDAKFSFFHSVHSVPAIGARIRVNSKGKIGVLHISGDHVSHKMMQTMFKEKGLREDRVEFFQGLLNGKENLVLMDVGGGRLHGQYRDYLDYPAQVAFMHTAQITDFMPQGKGLSESGEHFSFLP